MNSFSIIRSIFFTAFVVATIAIADHSKKRTLSIICCIAVFAGLLVFDLNYPAENFFYGFKTAEQAFSYSNDGEIKHVIEGSESGMVTYKTKDANGTCILPKDGSRWKLDSLFYYKEVYNKYFSYEDQPCNIMIFHAKGTDDYYVEILCFYSSREITVSDNRGSVFLREENSSPLSTAMFYSYVNSVDNTYKIYINDCTVQVTLGDKDIKTVTPLK